MEKYQPELSCDEGQMSLIDQQANAAQVIDLEIQKMEQIARETFFCACFLPCHYDHGNQGKNLEVIIQDSRIANKVDYVVKDYIPETVSNKHLSVNRLKVSYK